MDRERRACPGQSLRDVGLNEKTLECGDEVGRRCNLVCLPCRAGADHRGQGKQGNGLGRKKSPVAQGPGNGNLTVAGGEEYGWSQSFRAIAMPNLWPLAA